MSDLQPILDILGAKYSWVTTVSLWLTVVVTVFRLVLKPFNNRLQEKLTATIINATKNEEDATWWHDHVLSTTWYRVVSFTLDLLVSVKLPSHADYHDLVAVKLPTPDRVLCQTTDTKS